MVKATNSLSFYLRRLLKIVGIEEVSYNELVEEVIVKREDPSFNWLELQPKVIAVLLETYTLPKHSIHLDNIR